MSNSNTTTQAPQAGSLLNQARQSANRQMSPTENIRSMINKSESQLLMVLQTPEKVQRFQREFMTMVQGNNRLLQCEPKSLIGAAIQSAQLGLSLDKVMGQAYVVPYGNEAQFQIGYQGYLELARRSGEIKGIFSNIVYEGDYFVNEYTMEGAHLIHRPVTPSKRGERIGVYMIANFVNGGSHAEFMWAEEVMQIKALSKGANRNDSPWKNHEEAMWKKTVIKRASTYLPLAVEARQAIRIDQLQDDEVKKVDYSPLVDGNEVEVIDVNQE